ncbi:MAG: hypothetical protein HRU17_14070 [Polyangiaceae bacterium]|nr:hypothetical protein [Polyangiaceae bacterium]
MRWALDPTASSVNGDMSSDSAGAEIEGDEGAGIKPLKDSGAATAAPGLAQQ